MKIDLLNFSFNEVGYFDNIENGLEIKKFLYFFLFFYGLVSSLLKYSRRSRVGIFSVSNLGLGG